MTDVTLVLHYLPLLFDPLETSYGKKRMFYQNYYYQIFRENRSSNTNFSAAVLKLWDALSIVLSRKFNSL